MKSEICMLLAGFYASENQNKRKIQTENKTRQDKNLKISSIQVIEGLFSFRKAFEFEGSSTGSGDISTGPRSFFHFAFKENQSIAWYAEAVDWAVIRKLEEI